MQQCDTPEELYERPRNTFVAGFIGSPSISLMDAALTGGDATFHGMRVPLSRGIKATSDRVTIGVRPEAFVVAQPGEAGALELEVELVETLGSEAFVYGRPAGEPDGPRIGTRVDKRVRPTQGDRFAVKPMTDHVHVFDTETGERL